MAKTEFYIVGISSDAKDYLVASVNIDKTSVQLSATRWCHVEEVYGMALTNAYCPSGKFKSLAGTQGSLSRFIGAPRTLTAVRRTAGAPIFVIQAETASGAVGVRILSGEAIYSLMAGKNFTLTNCTADKRGVVRGIQHSIERLG